MMDDAPIFEVDYEFTFANGNVDVTTIREGRDTHENGPDTVCIVIEHPDGATETIEVYKRELARLRTARREVKPEPLPAGSVTH